MRPLRIDEAAVAAPNGRLIRAQRFGGGPPLLLCSPLGADWRVWRHQLTHFADRYRLSCWDYAGLRPNSPEREALSVQEHADDALRVTSAETQEPFAVLAWSLGVQVALELYRRDPTRVRALILIDGAPGYPIENWALVGRFARWLPRLVALLRTFPSVPERLTARMARWPETAEWVRRLGFASHTLDEELLQELASSFADLSAPAYLSALERFAQHDAWDLLPRIGVPTLVIAGDRDRFTSRRVAERMVRQIPKAEFLVVPGGTAFSATEYPELVNLRVDKFLLERGLDSGSARAA